MVLDTIRESYQDMSYGGWCVCMLYSLLLPLPFCPFVPYEEFEGLWRCRGHAAPGLAVCILFRKREWEGLPALPLPKAPADLRVPFLMPSWWGTVCPHSLRWLLESSAWTSYNIPQYPVPDLPACPVLRPCSMVGTNWNSFLELFWPIFSRLVNKIMQKNLA